eukprot:TRINITY_DN8440_c0_g2_i1.p1 TRINITY_DN8440_c0_g2~~TRINITY_DN8440_c0_g2_i1.p1  ORF type:complete len:587 (-),score=81.09 TRINITY_DN8440_c0_g2_i1:266-2026(-)
MFTSPNIKPVFFRRRSSCPGQNISGETDRNRTRQHRYWHKNKEKINQRRREAYSLKNKESINQRRREAYWLKKGIVGIVEQKEKKRSWATPEQLRDFFESVKEKLHISSTNDWYRVSQKQMKSHGGSGVFQKYKKLGVALQQAYPEIEWDMCKFSCTRKRSGQRWLKVVLSRLLPSNTEITENYLHQELFWASTSYTQKMELDIWVPEYNLALEYQGEQHYFDIHEAYGPNGTTAMYKERDLKKKIACAEKGITLVEIPYWWDGQEESLASTLHVLRPDIFPMIDSSPIPSEPPTASSTTKLLSSLGNHRIASLMMNGREWHPSDQDPTDWIISEKLDGMRAYWDGSRLYSKQGFVFPAPLEFLDSLPKNVSLDGELWAGYESLEKLASVLRFSYNLSKNNDDRSLSELWKPIKFCVFDAPLHPGFYSARLSFARECVSRGDDRYVHVIPTQVCLGLEHLRLMLQVVIKRKGEGLILYHPSQPYIPGRTSYVQKVKAYKEADVMFVKCNPNSYTFLCQQLNGVTCIIKCSGWDYENPPLLGTVLTVRHMGFHERSKKMKYPFLLRVRSELCWKSLKCAYAEGFLKT